MNNDYEYVGVPLTPSIAQKLIKGAFSGKTATRREIVEIVVQIHDERGGLPSEAKDVRTTIKSALQNLKKMELPHILPRIVGKSIQAPITLKKRFLKVLNLLTYPMRKKSSNPMRLLKSDQEMVRSTSTISLFIERWQNPKESLFGHARLAELKGILSSE